MDKIQVMETKLLASTTRRQMERTKVCLIARSRVTIDHVYFPVIYAYTGRYIVDNVWFPHIMFLDFRLVVPSQKLRKALVEPLPRGSKLFVSECFKASCNASSLLWDTGTVGLLPLRDDFGSVLVVLLFS